MRLSVSARIAVFASLTFLTLAIGQETVPPRKHMSIAPLNGSRPVTVSALNIERGAQYPTIVRLSGSVEIRTPFCAPPGSDWKVTCYGEMIVRADEVQFHEDTGQIEAHGNVVVTPPQ
jgi:lipopolysaccharide assembly outer membrane protein LptD (OstA)